MNASDEGKASKLLVMLDEVEAEMRAIGYWSDAPPDLLAEVEAGRLRSYLDAPTFELWLQCVFLPSARQAVLERALPAGSQVGLMAMRQYDYHSHVPEAQRLVALLFEFDALVEGRPSPSELMARFEAGEDFSQMG